LQEHLSFQILLIHVHTALIHDFLNVFDVSDNMSKLIGLSHPKFSQPTYIHSLPFAAFYQNIYYFHDLKRPCPFADEANAS